MENKIMLITYPDSLGGNLQTLEKALGRFFSREVGLVHILPFFPSSGDRGFAPITYDRVEEAFGDWSDIRRLGERYGLMSDFMINHISRRSPQFLDYQKNRDASPYRELFLNWTRFWDGEPSREEADRIYKRKGRDPYVEIPFADGSAEKIWCTFSEEQLDLDLRSETAWNFVRESMERMAENGIRIIRLDAFAYAVKKRGGSCFFEEPEIWELLGRVEAIAKELGAELLPEMHEHYSIQLKIAEHGYWVYDFALPMLTLYTLYKGDATRLKHWLSICPRRQFTTLDTHDGIGVVDVKDLMTDEEMEEAVDLLFEKGANVKRSYNSAEYQNLDIYQINCTYYSALGDDDDAYLLARAIQFFAPGIPQVYYVGLLAGANDIDFMERTKFGRNINRHNYTEQELEQEACRPVVRRLCALMRLRNGHPAFAVEGECIVEDTPPQVLRIVRRYAGYEAVLTADLKQKTFSVSCTDAETWEADLREAGCQME